MARMNWGKRFGQGPVNVDYKYDIGLHKGRMPPKRFLNREYIDFFISGIKGVNVLASRKSKCYLGKPMANTERQDAEEQLLETISKCADVITFQLQHLMASPPPLSNSYRTEVCQKDVIELLRRMCMISKREMPEYGVSRRPGISTIRRCVECGTELTAGEQQRCCHCEENILALYNAQLPEEQRIEKENLKDTARTVKAMQTMLFRIKRKKEKDHARYSRYQSKNASALEIGGPEQNKRLGGPPSHRNSASDSRYVESGNDGSALESNPHSSSDNNTEIIETGDGGSQNS